MNNSEPVPELSHPWLYRLAALLSLVGLADSVYLTVTHLISRIVKQDQPVHLARQTNRRDPFPVDACFFHHRADAG